MANVRAIIADDEKALRDYLRKKLLLLWPELSVVGEAIDGEAALGLIRGERPNIAFLDISMPGMSGLEVAQRAPGQCLFVFITAHDKYAIDAFENDAVDYLLKPVTDERLGKTLKRLKERLAASSAAPDISVVLEKVP
jgi:DNA-binding LytR/AlgR family response regulator